MSHVTPMEDESMPEERDESEMRLENVASLRESPAATLPPTNVATLEPIALLVVGQSLPPFSQETLLSFDMSKYKSQLYSSLRGMKVIHGTIPAVLQHFDAPEWRN